MTTALNLIKAQLIEISWLEDGTVVPVAKGASTEVQFNPASLQVSYQS